MKRERAIQNLYRVLQRIRNVNGIFAIPLEDHEYVKIKRAWVFGSVAKGSHNPNDIDIFVELEGYIPDCLMRTKLPESHLRKSRRNRTRYIKGSKTPRLHGGFKPDKKSEAFKEMGFYFSMSSVSSLYTYLSRGIPSASIHFIHDDLIFDRLDVKHLIYPRCDFDFEGAISDSYKKKYKEVRVLP